MWGGRGDNSPEFICEQEHREDYSSQTFQQMIPAADSQHHQHQIEAHFISPLRQAYSWDQIPIAL